MPLPPKQGLYDPQFEHDACGLGFVATLDRTATHAVLKQALEILANLTHRGAAGCDPCTGDGAGVLLQLPHAFFSAEVHGLPAPGDYGVAMCFFPRAPARRRKLEALLEAAVLHHGQGLIGWRDVPVVPAAIGPSALETMPVMRQLFIRRLCPSADFERRLFMIRKRAGSAAHSDDFYVASCSSKTVVYKGLMLAEQVSAFFPDLSDSRTVTRLAMVHSRFSTNTFPSWERAHPFRRIAHNGEINTLNGNRTWLAAREPLLKSALFGAAIEDFKPIIRAGGSDSAALDNVVDFLVASGRSLPHVMMMLVPEAFADDLAMSQELRAFYAYHGCLIEPWDGPAALTFTDGDLIGAMLDRNGLRPAKYVTTRDGLVVLASELGVLELDPSRIVTKGRVQPGRVFLVDTAQGRVVPDEEVKHRVATQQPYRAWLQENRISLEDLPPSKSPWTVEGERLTQQLSAFGYTTEDVQRLLLPAATLGEEPTGSMGIDIPLAVLSDKPQQLFRYFKQQFAQVTNPPVDAIREACVMSLVSCLGPEGNLVEETPQQCHQLQLPHPLLTSDDLARLRSGLRGDFRITTLPMRFTKVRGTALPGATLQAALERLCTEAERAVREGASILILSDRDVGPFDVPIPSLLATAAVHHHLIRCQLRMNAGLVVETGEVREVHHVALLVGYGAGAVNPWLALDAVSEAARQGRLDKPLAEDTARENLVYAMKKGLLKVMSKMGISAVASYQGAQMFEALGVDQWVIDRYFTGTTSRLRGVGLPEFEADALARHESAYGPRASGLLEVGGHIHVRAGGESHLWTSQTVSDLQRAVRLEDAGSYEAYARAINTPGTHPVTLRALWDLKPLGPPVPLSEVEPATELVKRFATGAMSFGSISKEAHENLAIAMNRIGGRSNTGEGGEDPARWVPESNGDSKRSAIKQVASGRFGVTAAYLSSAEEVQIKMAQGAKPGEGGQLPGHKVDEVIARVRHSIPGVTLISPPPHHDIYSIEDLAQLIFDLKNVNPRARISVKLVAAAGVGTIAAGVAKAHADAILIAGHDGGTGAAPLTSIHHVGVPWELGLAEAQQVLVLNGLRGRVRLQVDGQLKTGRDVVIAALLGAEEFGFATAPLVASGCIMMRKCHLNTCPVGVATQDPELRKRFAGKPEHVIRYLFYVAEEARALMASLGVRTLSGLVGRVEAIAPRDMSAHPRLSKIDFSELLYRPREATGPLRCIEAQDHNLAGVQDRALLPKVAEALEHKKPVRLEVKLRNGDRAFGAMLSGEVARRYGDAGLPEGTLTLTARGSAGQSFGAFLARGLTLDLHGDANDYVGKGLSGGVVVVRPPAGSRFTPDAQVIVGNTVLYGATAGKAFFNGRAGERFAVRNSGALAVVEGVGDHGCEYMTGGQVVVLGSTGRNFAAGMSGGTAYVLDGDGTFGARCNLETVELEALAGPEREGVRKLVEEHLQRTGSPRALSVLDGWAKARWVKVMPTEYKKLLAARALQQVPAPSPEAIASAPKGARS